MNREDPWLLEQPSSHSSYPIRHEEITIKTSSFRKQDISVLLYHPETPANNPLERELVLCESGWTETRLDKQARSIGRVGLHAACFNHPRRGALRDLWSLLVASRNLRANWQELSNAIWEEKDLERAEGVLIDMLADQVADEDDRKTLFSAAVSAGKSRRDNLLAVTDRLREENFDLHLLGHSLGGIDVTMATKAAPQHVKSLSLAGPGGVMINDSVGGIIPRVAATVVGERAEVFHNVRELARMAVNTVLFIAENPALTIYEGGYAATSRLEKSLWDIMADYGIPTTLILGEKDKMFPTDIVTQDIQPIPFAGTVIIPGAGHNMTLHQADIVARIMRNIAMDVDDRRSGRLEVNMKNALAMRAHLRPTDTMSMTDVEKDLFKRND